MQKQGRGHSTCFKKEPCTIFIQPNHRRKGEPPDLDGVGEKKKTEKELSRQESSTATKKSTQHKGGGEENI